jgi:hypothetical protein
VLLSSFLTDVHLRIWTCVRQLRNIKSYKLLTLNDVHNWREYVHMRTSDTMFPFFFFEVLNDVHIRKCMVRSTYVVWILNWTKRWRTSLRVVLHNWPQRWRTSLYVVLHKASLSTYTYVIKKLSINVPSTYALKIFNWRKRCSSIYKWMVRSTYVILWILNWRKRSRTSLYTVLHKASPYVNVRYTKFSTDVRTYALKIFNWRKRCSSMSVIFMKMHRYVYV